MSFNEFYDNDFFAIYDYDRSLYFKIENNVCIQFYDSLSIELKEGYTTHDIIINNNYLKRETRVIANKHLLKKELISNLFKSNAERDEYIILKNKYPNCIIIPNYKFSTAFRVGGLKKYLNNDKINYLKTCILDFIIFDKDGTPFKVREVQKGEHHNDNKWIWKDNVKKQALEVLGIDYKEIF